MPTVFQEKVWGLLEKIPKGKVSTYLELAKALNCPDGSRAVGNALNKNSGAPKMPCHRIVKSNGELGGYAFGLKKKKSLLQAEGIDFSGNRIVNFNERFFKFEKY